MKKNTTKKYLLVFLLLVSVNTSAEGKKTIGTNSPIITTKSGGVEINKTDLGDSIATKIITNNQKTNIHLRKKVTKNVFNMLTKLDIPIKIGMSEIFYNNKTNIFHVKNHKTNKIVRIYLNKNINNYINNYINNSRTNIDNSRVTNNSTINIDKSTNIGLLDLSSYTSLSIGVSHATNNNYYKNTVKKNRINKKTESNNLPPKASEF